MRCLGQLYWLNLGLLCNFLIWISFLSANGFEAEKDFALLSRAESLEISPFGGNVSVICDKILANASTTSVFISENGNDSQDCICRGAASPCRTIQHAYYQTMLQISNKTKSLKFIFMDEVYNMAGGFLANRQGSFLQNVEFTSTLRTIIRAIDPNAVFLIGCNISNPSPCISYNVKFNNLIFRNFGSNLPAVIVVFTINLLSFENCSFSRNNCSAINSLDTSVQLQGVEFMENRGTSNFKGSTNDFSAAFPISNVSNGGALALVFRNGYGKHVNISNCRFIKNKAATNLTLPYVEHKLGDTQFPRVGGGILFLFMKNCSKVSANIINSNFTNNTAYAAGAVAILSESYSTSNKIAFKHCRFEHNIVKSTAGAILFANWDYTQKNKLSITNCIFKNNRAKYAGAIKYLINIIQREEGTASEEPGFELVASQLCGNIAETGSAIHFITDASIYRHPISPVHIVDSVFCQHDISGEKEDRQSVSQYGGTILSHKIDIKFMGNNSIEKNKVGCGLYASNANIHVNGTLIFSKNVATASGGGMALADTSHLILYPGSHLRFEENHSGTKGGALAVFTIGMPELTYVYNPFCFLQYSIPNLPHSKWDTKVEFIGNSAQLKAAAIFINTMTACLWTEFPPHRSFEKAFRWNDNFVYKNNFVNAMYSNILTNEDSKTVYQVDIATDTYKLVLGGSKQVTLAPGETVFFNLSGYDELKSETYSVPIANSLARLKNGKSITSYLELPNKYFVLDPYGKTKFKPLYYEVDATYYKGITNSNIQHEIQFFDTYSSYIAKATLNLTPILCRPGFVYNGKGACQCDKQTFIQDCNGTEVTLENGLWANDFNGKLKAFPCPPNYCKCTKYEKRTSCIYDSLNANSQCTENRQGILCGGCIGHGHGLSLDSGECIKCDHESMKTAKGGLIFVTIGVFLAAILVVYLNPSFSTKLRGPAFYVQLLPYLYNGSSLLGTFVRFMASFLTLGGSSGLPIFGCLGPNWDRLDIIALTYVFAAVILLVLFAVYVLSRCFVLRFERDSPFESFWILLIATYCFFSETSLQFFYCVDINGKKKFFYDGTLDCYTGKHLVMVTVSSVLLLFFVLLPPIAVMLICAGRTNAPLQVVDVLTKGLRLRFRWWWAFDLIRRFAYVAVFVFITRQGVRQVTFIILSNVVLTFHTFCQPYVDLFANISEAFLLFSLTTVATLQLADTKDGPAETLATVIIVLNYTYMIVLFLYLLARFIQKRYKLKFGNLFQRFENQRIPIPNRPLTPGRVENS